MTSAGAAATKDTARGGAAGASRMFPLRLAALWGAQRVVAGLSHMRLGPGLFSPG